MAKLQLKLYQKSATDETTSTTTISNANPAASDSTLLTFAQKLSSLTSGIYQSTDKVTTINLDTEGGTKQTPTLALSQSTITTSNILSQSRQISITYNGDGTLYVSEPNDDPGTITYKIYNNYLTLNGGSGPNPCTLTIYATETSNYAAANTTLNIVLAN